MIGIVDKVFFDVYDNVRKKEMFYMLAQERFAAILSILKEKKTVSVTELTKLLQISESTIRRDLIALDKAEKLRKIHGGATLLQKEYKTFENDLILREKEHIEEKRRLAQYAASLIEEHDFVYLDAGSTIMQMADFIEERNAIYVTNSLELAKQLALNGFQIFLLAGEVKAKAMATVGIGAVSTLQKYNFTKAFLGGNGITIENGYTTPDMQEAHVKTEAMRHAKKSYVLADSSKFGVCSSITFADIMDANIITIRGVGQEYKDETNIIEIDL